MVLLGHSRPSGAFCPGDRRERRNAEIRFWDGTGSEELEWTEDHTTMSHTLLVLLTILATVVALFALDRLEFLSVFRRPRKQRPGGDDPPGGTAGR
jgi:preprotein translocase subunit SecE